MQQPGGQSCDGGHRCQMGAGHFWLHRRRRTLLEWRHSIHAADVSVTPVRGRFIKKNIRKNWFRRFHPRKLQGVGFMLQKVCATLVKVHDLANRDLNTARQAYEHTRRDQQRTLKTHNKRLHKRWWEENASFLARYDGFGSIRNHSFSDEAPWTVSSRVFVSFLTLTGQHQSTAVQVRNETEVQHTAHVWLDHTRERATAGKLRNRSRAGFRQAYVPELLTRKFDDEHKRHKISSLALSA